MRPTIRVVSMAVLLRSRRKAAQGPSDLGVGSPVQRGSRPPACPLWPVQLCCPPPGVRDQSRPPHACFPHAHDGPCRLEWPRGTDQGQSALSQSVYGHRSREPEAGGRGRGSRRVFQALGSDGALLGALGGASVLANRGAGGRERPCQNQSIKVTHLPSPPAPNRAAWTSLSGTLSALGCHRTTRDPGKQPDPEKAR